MTSLIDIKLKMLKKIYNNIEKNRYRLIELKGGSNYNKNINRIKYNIPIINDKLNVNKNNEEQNINKILLEISNGMNILIKRYNNELDKIGNNLDSNNILLNSLNYINNNI